MSTIMDRLEKKFGSSYGKSAQKCVSSWKSKGNELLREAGVDFEGMKNLENVKGAKTRPNKQLELVMTALKIFLMTHGGNLRQPMGLEMFMGLDGCSEARSVFESKADRLHAPFRFTLVMFITM